MTTTKKPKPETPKTETPTPAETKQIQVIEKVIESRAIAPQDAFGKLTRSQLELMKTTIAKGASDDELKLFIQVCKGAQLNPFLKQVHLVPRWDSKLGKEVRAIQVAIDGFRSIAESSGCYAGNDDAVFDGELTIEYGLNERKKVQVPASAKVTVYKIVAGLRCPFTATARWNEYYPGEKMGFQWHQKPYLMLGKCAEALALRKAFPKLLSGMYAQEEMDKGIQTDEPAQKVAKGLQTVLKMIEGATYEELAEYREKMAKSPKYTKEQKAEFFEAVDRRMAELTPAK
jgi:phage recombination protein Bet